MVSPTPSRRASARERATVVEPFPDDRLNGCPDVAARLKQADAAFEQARAWHRLADVAEQALAEFKPAVDVVTDLSARFAALCKWLRGKWPWIGMAAVMVLGRTVNMAPDELPKLIEAVANLYKVVVGP